MDRSERKFEDLLNRAEIKDWLYRAEREMFPKMKGSVLSLVIGGEPDGKLALEVGAAVLFNKPIVLVAVKGRKIPDGLRRMAHKIIEIDDFSSDEGRDKVVQALDEIAGENGAAKFTSPRTLADLCDWIEVHGDEIYVRDIVNGKSDAYRLTELPAKRALHHALLWIRTGFIPVFVPKE